MKTIPSPLHITEGNFENEVLHSDKPVLVDFWAEWCSPCKAMNPILEDLAKEYANQLKIAKVNIDECPDLAAQFNIRSIPTFLLFNEGKVVSELIGAASKATLKTKINEQITI